MTEKEKTPTYEEVFSAAIHRGALIGSIFGALTAYASIKEHHKMIPIEVFFKRVNKILEDYEDQGQPQLSELEEEILNTILVNKQALTQEKFKEDLR